MAFGTFFFVFVWMIANFHMKVVYIPRPSSAHCKSRAVTIDSLLCHIIILRVPSLVRYPFFFFFTLNTILLLVNCVYNSLCARSTTKPHTGCRISGVDICSSSARCLCFHKQHMWQIHFDGSYNLP